jgi:hypothetical protein
MSTVNVNTVKAFQLARELLKIRGSYYPTYDHTKSEQEYQDLVMAHVREQIQLAHQIIDYQDKELLCKAAQEQQEI